MPYSKMGRKKPHSLPRCYLCGQQKRSVKPAPGHGDLCKRCRQRLRQLLLGVEP